MTETSSPIVTEEAPKVKKTRQARKPKVAAETDETANVVASKPGKKTRAKRGTNALAAKSPEPPARAARGASTAVPVASVESAGSDAGPGDEFGDLIKLEEENKSLRKQLADKLRAENADLRKRIGQN